MARAAPSPYVSAPMIRIARAAALLPLVLASGCYTYTQAELDTLPEDAYVRIYMTRRGIGEIPEGIPVGATYLTGRFQTQTRDSVLIAVPTQHAVEGGGARDLAQNVYVPTAEIVSVDRRKLHGPKTFLAIAGGGAVIAGAVIGVASSGGASEAEKTGAGGD